MCGIVGYIGKNNASDILFSGLSNLEYRGYDSSGIAMIEDDSIKIKKTEGRLSNLKKIFDESPIYSKIGIGHTRWATHGDPSTINSHPHTNKDHTIAVVHNGIIENYQSLKNELTEKGYVFISDTDTEVIPHLIDYYYNGDFFNAFKEAISRLTGSFAIGSVSLHEPDKIFAVRKDSPLIVGLSQDEHFIASDMPAILNKTNDFYLLENNEFVILTQKEVIITDRMGNKINKDIFRADFSSQASDKDGFEHYMLKEIYEQPTAIKNTILNRLNGDLKISLDSIHFSNSIKKIYIVACGTAYHAGLVGKYAIETLAKIPCEVCLASEFRYSNPLLNENTAVLVVSQSGETADTIAALKMAKAHNNTVYAITNVAGSSIDRESDYVFYTHAGPEISVASTKAYTTQLVAFYLFAIYLAENNNKLSDNDSKKIKEQLFSIGDYVESALKCENKIKEIAKRIAKEHDIYFIGRGLDYFVALEASLKLKELSYIHSDAYAAGELKHGPIALVEKNTIVISICTNPEIYDKINNNVKEVIARGAYTIGFTSVKQDISIFDEVIELPNINPLFAPLSAIVPLQLLAYYVCLEKGFDVDKPRNLAKSVTVE